MTLYNCEQYDYSDIVSKIMAAYVKKENIVLLEKKNKGENLEKENLSIGDIVLIKQIVFSNDERAEADHSFGSGRPCMFAGSKNGKMYFFPLSGYKPKNKDYLFFLNPNEENGLKKVSGIRANKILEMPYQSFQTVGFISEKKVLNIIKSFILYYHNNYETLSERHIYDTVFYIFNNKVKSEKNLKKLKK